MLLNPGVVFDRLAPKYDALWTNTAIGRAQREAVWRWIDPLFVPGDCILDLGCGTGADAIHMMARRLNVKGVDASAEMVSAARAHGVNAQQLTLENLDCVNGEFDGALSNFGVLNCVSDLPALSLQIGRLIRRKSFLAACLMGPACVWETCYYLKHLKPAKAFRRWGIQGCVSSLGIPLHYPTIHRVRSAFKNRFRLVSWVGIGLAVPPSYVAGLSPTVVSWLQSVDQRVAHWPVLRMFADHRLLLFRRI
jgi:SAM-dependent methyltransferase